MFGRRSNFFLYGLGLSLILFGTAACGDATQLDAEPFEEAEVDDEGPLALETRDSEIRGGTVMSSPSGVWESIGRIPGCTATLVSEYSALTAAHCVTDGNSVTFTAPNGRGTITGTARHYPIYEDLHWLSHDYAVIKFNTSIYNAPNLNGSGLTPMQVYDDTMSVNDGVYIFGYGKHGTTDCSNGSDGNLRYVWASLDEVEDDWHYMINDPDAGQCPGDSGGPTVAYRDGAWRIVSINSWSSGDKSYSRPSYMITDWLHENSGRPDLPGDTWGHCVMYDTDAGGAWWSGRGNHSSLGDWNNRASALWVKKGYKATTYDYSNYSTELGTRDGFNGADCNEYGCYHDLTGTSMDNDISSIKCESSLPGNTWGHCVGYTRYGNGAYISLQGYHSSFSGSNEAWDNAISHLWVKNGHTARIYPKTNYGGVVNNHWTVRYYSGSSGDWCNSHGCMHDLVGTVGENTASSLKCD